MSSSSRRAAMLGGAALTAGGVVTWKSAETDLDGDGQNDTFLDDNPFLYLAGSVMILAGVVTLVAAIASDESSEPATDGPSATAASAATGPPPTVETPSGDASEPEHRTITVERVPAIPLPDVPTSEAAHRLARQLRSASAHGHCDVAWIMWRDLEKLDAAYARAVRDSPVMARCAP